MKLPVKGDVYKRDDLWPLEALLWLGDGNVPSRDIHKGLHRSSKTDTPGFGQQPKAFHHHPANYIYTHTYIYIYLPFCGSCDDRANRSFWIKLWHPQWNWTGPSTIASIKKNHQNTSVSYHWIHGFHQRFSSFPWSKSTTFWVSHARNLQFWIFASLIHPSPAFSRGFPWKKWRFPQMGVSGIPKSSILVGSSIVNHPFWGTPQWLLYGNSHCHIWCLTIMVPLDPIMIVIPFISH